MAARRPPSQLSDARALAVEALVRIDDEGAYANLVLPAMLARSSLDERDRAFATDLVYGTTRMRRALDHLVDGHLRREVEPAVRAALRLGAYQLAFLGTPPHAAVAATVSAAPTRARGLVNAVLRKVAASAPYRWPDPPTRLSYPDWVVERLAADLGADAALAALEAMNQAPEVTVRDDGYVQDEASQAVAEAVEAEPGDVVVDLCAAPGGKATLLAHAGAAVVVAGDVQEGRTGLVAGNAAATGADAVAPLVADGTLPPLRRGTADRVLVDAPCSGLGVLRRRPDARWRVHPDDVDELAALQRRLLEAAVPLLRPGGVLVYSVCTVTEAETGDVDRWLAATHPALDPLPPPAGIWRPHGRGARVLPQDHGTDGMFLLRLRRPERG